MTLRSPALRAKTVALLTASVAVFACSEQPITVPVRSLEQSGDVAFLCLDTTDKEHPGRWIDTCASTFDVTSGEPSTGNLIALVTQTTRGEVAMINLSTESVMDLDPAKPGFNFIPVGANPVDIATTPGGTVAFMGSAEANREGIWILPSHTLVAGAPHLSSFAACALPSAPGAMQVLVQGFPTGAAPSKCSGEEYADPEHANGDLAQETEPSGTRKLLVSLPDLGALVLMDAQELLDFPAGSFRACPIERWIPLQIDLPPSLPQQRTPEGGYPPGVAADGSACGLTDRTDVPAGQGFAPRPAQMSLDSTTGLLYVADEEAPVIHVLDASSPCDLTERPPLLPMSAERPDRVVVSRNVSVSPITSDGKKFLYATDYMDGSVMVFDISVDATDRTPQMRPFPWRSPYQPLDRISFSVPVRDVEFVLRDSPVEDPTSGVAPIGLACNPDDNTALGARYRTSSDFTSGARPLKLRGIFAALALTNGQIVVVDVDDFDGACRRPKEAGACVHEKLASYEGASGEASCSAVERHQPRSGYFLHAADDANGRLPSLQAFPILSLDSSILPTDQTPAALENPKLLAPKSSSGVLLVGGRLVEEIDSDPKTAEKASLVFDVTEPRVHFSQDWRVTFEGALPGFSGHVGRFDPVSSETGRTTFYDGGAFFCDRGVHDINASRLVAATKGIEPTPADPNYPATWALNHVDVLHITEDFLDENDTYWESVRGSCGWIQCRETFGVVDDPKSTRDFPIVEATQGALVVDGVYDFVRCCYPTLVSYTVRPRNQWAVTGSNSGFLHRVVPDPATGRCIESCDPNKVLLNGRAFDRALAEPIPDFNSEGAFRNPVLQFVIWQGQVPTERDMSFSFSQTGGFAPLLVNIAASTSFIQPQSMDIVPRTGELAIADGSAQGLVLIDLGSVSVSRSFF